MYIKNTKNHQSHPAPHQKRWKQKKKRTKQASDPRAKFVQQHAPCSATFFISLPYFFPSFHSHSTTKKEKSLKYDRNAPLRRPRSLDSTEAVLQIGGFFFKNVPGGFLTFVPQNQSISLVRLSLAGGEGTVSLPDLPPKTRFCELNK